MYALVQDLQICKQSPTRDSYCVHYLLAHQYFRVSYCKVVQRVTFVPPCSRMSCVQPLNFVMTATEFGEDQAKWLLSSQH